MIKEGFNIHVIKGNHEAMMLDSRGNPGIFSTWLYNGGNLCLTQYMKLKLKNIKIDLNQNYSINAFNFSHYIPKPDWEFIESLPILIELEDYVLVHANLEFYFADPIKETSDNTKLWSRD